MLQLIKNIQYSAIVRSSNEKIRIVKLYSYLALCLLLFSTILSSCKKIVEIDPPTNTIVSEEAFQNDYTATASVMGIYSKLINQSRQFSFGNGIISSLIGISSDETAFFGSDPELSPIFSNQIASDNGSVLLLWQTAYAIIYDANACLEQLKDNKNITPNLRTQLISEAIFIRSYCYFYLINIFGDVPFLTTTNFKNNAVAPRTAIGDIYSSLINDLESSLNSLPDDFNSYNGERIRATKWAAIALLARISLYTGNWEKAGSYSSMIISNSNFQLVADLNKVFLKNSPEAIFQLSISGKRPSNDT